MLSLTRLSNGKPEIFRSIQGEGVNSGTTACFLRLAFCNLKCSWCDTRYSWDWQHYDQNIEVLKISSTDVAEYLRALGTRHLIVTGGEPLIQQKDLCELLAPLKEEKYYVEVETNGTISPIDELLTLVDQWNVSPKLENSGNLSSAREVPEAYRMFVSLSSSYFKYVIQSESDLKEVHSLVNEYRVPPERVILMPEGTDRDTILSRGRWLAELCGNHGYKLSTRLHVLLWGNTRGM